MLERQQGKCKKDLDSAILWRESILNYISKAQPKLHKVEILYGGSLSVKYTCDGLQGLNKKLKIKFKNRLGEIESILFRDSCNQVKQFFSEPIYIDEYDWVGVYLDKELFNAMLSSKNLPDLIDKAYLEINGVSHSSGISSTINPVKYSLDIDEKLSEPIIIPIKLL